MFRLALGGVLLACLVYDVISYKSSFYDSNRGRCKHVAFHEEMTTWCINNDKQIFVQKDGQWKLVEGRLDLISLGFAGVWGILKDGRVYYRQGVSVEKPEGVMWSKVDGSLSHIATGSEGVVWGITKSEKLVYRHGMTYSNPMGTEWKELKDVFFKPLRVSCNMKGCWAVGSFGNMKFRNGVTRMNPMGTSWASITAPRVPGRLAEISTSGDGHTTIVLMSNENLYVWHGGFNGEKVIQGEWKLVQGPYLGAVPVHEGFLAVSKDFSLKYLMKVPDFMDVYKPMDQIDAGKNGSVCGLSSEKIYQKQGKRWIQIEGALKHVSCSDHQIWGINRYNDVYYRMGANRRNHFGSDWKKLKGSFKQIDVCKFGMVYSVDNFDRVYRRGGITTELPFGDKWINIPGRLRQVSCGNYGLWGVDYRKKVHMKSLFPKHSEHQFQAVSKQALRKVEASDAGYVLGICDMNILRMRMGISRMNPMGSGWMEWMNNVHDVAPHKGGVFIITRDKQVKHASFSRMHL